MDSSPLYLNREKGSSELELHDDLVNISGECDVGEDDVMSKIKPTIFKEYRAGMRLEDDNSPAKESDTLSQMLKGSSPI